MPSQASGCLVIYKSFAFDFSLPETWQNSNYCDTVTCHRLITLCTQRVNSGCRKPDEIKGLHALIAQHAESYFHTTFQAEAPIAKRDEMRPWSFRFHRLRCDRQQRQQSIRMQHFEEPRFPVLGYGINKDESSELCAQI